MFRLVSWVPTEMHTQCMADLQDSQSELPPIQIEDMPSATKDEILKKQLVLVGIGVMVLLVCRAILYIGSGV